jgi:hypothetical protein
VEAGRANARPGSYGDSRPRPATHVAPDGVQKHFVLHGIDLETMALEVA